MGVEIERKFLIEQAKSDELKCQYNNKSMGIVQWYTDGGMNIRQTERIRLIINEEGYTWIRGRKQTTGESLVTRNEEEALIKSANLPPPDDLRHFPFVAKIRFQFNQVESVEMVLDQYVQTLSFSFDVNQLLEIEIIGERSKSELLFSQTIDFFDLNGRIREVSEDPRYTNQAIARQAFEKNTKTVPQLSKIIQEVEKALFKEG